MISILDDLIQKDWNADQRKRGLMLMELRDYTVEYVIKKYISIMPPKMIVFYRKITYIFLSYI